MLYIWREVGSRAEAKGQRKSTQNMAYIERTSEGLTSTSKDPPVGENKRKRKKIVKQEIKKGTNTKTYYTIR